jgi:hypothetical protein
VRLYESELRTRGLIRNDPLGSQGDNHRRYRDDSQADVKGVSPGSLFVDQEVGVQQGRKGDGRRFSGAEDVESMRLRDRRIHELVSKMPEQCRVRILEPGAPRPIHDFRLDSAGNHQGEKVQGVSQDLGAVTNHPEGCLEDRQWLLRLRGTLRGTLLRQLLGCLRQSRIVQAYSQVREFMSQGRWRVEQGDASLREGVEELGSG